MLGAQAKEPSCVGEDWTPAGLSIQENPSHFLLKTEPPFSCRRDLTPHTEGQSIWGKSYDDIELTFGYLSSSTCPPHPQSPLANHVMK